MDKESLHFYVLVSNDQLNWVFIARDLGYKNLFSTVLRGCTSYTLPLSSMHVIKGYARVIGYTPNLSILH